MFWSLFLSLEKERSPEIHSLSSLIICSIRISPGCFSLSCSLLYLVALQSLWARIACFHVFDQDNEVVLLLGCCSDIVASILVVSKLAAFLLACLDFLTKYLTSSITMNLDHVQKT